LTLFDNIDGLVLSKEVLSFRRPLEGSLLRNFEDGGVLITERPTKRLSGGHRREKLFDRYVSSTILLVDAVSGCRNAVQSLKA
jgi:hypothetical protein